MKKKKIEIVLIIPYVFLSIITIIIPLIICFQGCFTSISINPREIQEPVAIKMDLIPRLIEQHLMSPDRLDTSIDFDNYSYSIEKEINGEIIESVTSLWFVSENNESKNEKKVKLYHKSGDSYIDITPEKVEVSMETPEPTQGMVSGTTPKTRVIFTFYSLERLSIGEYYRIEYGDETIDFLMAYHTYTCYF